MSPFNCFYHPNLPAVAVCSRCGRGTCASCSKPYGALTMCPNCFHTIPTPQMAPGIVTAYPGSAPPPPPGLFGPIMPFNFFKSLWVPVILVGIAAALIFANGVALLSPTFFAVWTAFFPWVGFLGPVNFILGIILGMVLLGAIVLMLLRFKVLSAFMIFPTAMVSFFIGGGFILGAVLAVIGGILLII